MIKEIRGFEGLYAVDSDGNVWSLLQTSSRRKGKLKPYVNTGGYRRVNLYDQHGKVHKSYVHRLVAAAFLPNPSNLPAVNHINADKSNNSVGNLEWCDAEYNIAESRRLGLQKDMKIRVISILTGEVHFFNRLKDAAINLTGKEWGLQFLRQKYGDTFFFKEWKVEVMPK